MEIVLRCAECGVVDAGPVFGWRALLGLEDDRETETAAIFCPRCVEREFGGPSHAGFATKAD